ncbi:MAG: gliding motility-associated C-terminal domain-containing protein [Flavobacteriaceae bacterium]
MIPTNLRISQKLFWALCFCWLWLSPSAAQIVLNAPAPADNPNLAGNSPWTAICASPSFNEYFVEISWAGSPSGDNTFILELSNASGDFSNPLELATSNENNSNNPFTLSFAIPTDTRGQGYKMRVRSTNPAKTSPESDAYHMYYMDVTSNLNISVNGDGQPPGTVCSSESITLQVDNIDNPETYQYLWYRSGTLLTGESGHTLAVSQSGMYYTYIDYGSTCTGSGNTDSNIVDVTIGGGTNNISINTPSKTALCAGDTETLSINTTDPAWNYQWYKDGNAISGATASTYTVDSSSAGFEGEYQVEISGDDICSERSEGVTITNADNFTVTRDNAASVVLLPGQTKTLSVTTSAVSPSFEWYRNGASIGNDSATLDVTQEGDYYVAVTQGGGSCPGTIKNSEETNVVSPASFEMTIAYASNYEACVSTSIVLQVATITAVLDNDEKIDVTSDVTNSFTYQWKKDNANVGGATSNSISLTSTDENGDYVLDGTLGTYNVSSNTLSVTLLTSETVAITSNGTVYCSGGDPIVISTDTNLASETYAWEKDGTSYNTTDTSLTITETGIYRLALDKNGCTLYSNEITITPMDSSLVTLDPGDNIVFPEGGSATINASGGSSYRWFNENNDELGSTSSLTLTEPGNYRLVAMVDNCEVIKPFSVEHLDTFNVPNVITPNGDGANDQWIIPNTYSNKQDVNVIIYNDKGEELLNEMGYQNNWPDSTMGFPKQNMVFYYIIKNAEKTLKQGTITVIR